MASNRQIVDDQLCAHFVTFSVDQWRKLLDHDHPKRILLGVLNDLMEKRRKEEGGRRKEKG
ncbi:hypothetical protein [uncultured Rubinisphaera sp.]|uniref:hypothetical protein n=1 Tax=uncultured Rubinisphaera sp. TaxID=1678686 RepID=UPI0030D9B0A0